MLLMLLFNTLKKLKIKDSVSPNCLFSSKRAECWIKHSEGTERCRARADCLLQVQGPLTSAAHDTLHTQQSQQQSWSKTWKCSQTFRNLKRWQSSGLSWTVQRSGSEGLQPALCNQRKLKPNAFGCKWEAVLLQTVKSRAIVCPALNRKEVKPTSSCAVKN